MTYAQYCFPGLSYEEKSLMCHIDDDGRPDHCGYGCEEPKTTNTFYNNKGLPDTFSEFAELKFCEGGCTVPFPGIQNLASNCSAINPYTEKIF